MRRLRTWLTRALVTAGVLAAIVVAVFQLPGFGGRPVGARLARMQASPQFIDGRFENTPPQRTETALLRTLRPLSARVRASTHLPDSGRAAAARAAAHAAGPWAAGDVVRARLGAGRDRRRAAADRSRAVGPRVAGAGRADPVPSAADPARRPRAASTPWSSRTTTTTTSTWPPCSSWPRRGTHFYVGLGIGAHLERWQVPPPQIHEMDWWETAELKGVTDHLHAVAALFGPAGDGQLHAVELVDAARTPSAPSTSAATPATAPHFAEIRRRLGAGRPRR